MPTDRDDVFGSFPQKAHRGTERSEYADSLAIDERGDP